MEAEEKRPRRWDQGVPAADPLRIVHVMTRYLRGGSEKRLRDMVEAFPTASHELIVGDESSPEDARREVDLAGLWVVSTLIRQPSPLKDLRALASIRAILRRKTPALVVTHQSKAGVLGRLAARSVHAPSVHSLSMANFGPGYPSAQSRVFRRLEQGLHRSTSAYAVVGHDLARRYEEIGVPRGKLCVVRSGVQLPLEGEPAISAGDVRRRLGVPPARPLIAYVGSLEARKNVLDLALLLGYIMQETTTPPFLLVAGEGPVAGELQSALIRQGLDGDSTLAGFVDYPLSLIAAADVIVLLSRAEGVSQVLVQAAAVDTPFVAYQVDGVQELLQMGARGRAVPIGDVYGAAEATAEILRSPRLAREPAIDLREWSARAIRRNYQQLFTTALGRASSGELRR